MQCLQTYLMMYETLNACTAQVQDYELTQFLQAANPFQMEDDNRVITHFIETFQTQFKEDVVSSKQAYDFVVSFLATFHSKILLSYFTNCTSQYWQSRYQMIEA